MSFDIKNQKNKDLYEELIKILGTEKSFYDLEPIIEERDKYITEDLLIYIFENMVNTKLEILDIITDRVIDNIKKNIPTKNNFNTLELITNVLSGIIRIYPSELKRAGIPIILYKYITEEYYYEKNLNVREITLFWQKKLLFYNNELPVSIFLIIDDIKNIFLKNFGKIFTKNQIKLQVFSLIQIKIPEYFSYLDNTLKYIYTAYDEKKNILLDYFSLDVVSLIEKKSLQYSYICKIYKKLFNVNTKLLNDILGNNKKYLQIQQNNFTFIFDTIKKYFEYRMITYKENKLFGVLNYYDIIY